MAQTEYDSIVKTLRELNLPFQEFQHEQVRTSAEAAAVRGSKLSEGIKALVVQFKRASTPGKKWFAVIDVPADRKIDWKKAKAVLQASDVALAQEADVVAQTGCIPGGVPPFGHGQKLAIIADPSIFLQEYSEFNAGLKTHSIRIKSSDLKVALDSIGVAYLPVATEPPALNQTD
jgi:prolyl-tRNA editing enzyme YbaK/EbsC (Cys-tRNA(Pro) deacylase)